MRKTLFAALAATVAVAGIAWAANQVATDPLRKVLAVELYAVSTAIGISGSPIIAGMEARTSGGCTPYHLAGGTAASDNSGSIKGSAGQLCDLVPLNTTTTVYFLKLYDSATGPTCSSATNLKHVFPIPPASASGGVGGLARAVPLGEAYANGIGFCVVAGSADNDDTNAATGVFIEASYK